MINTILERFSQYWETFASAPIEFQVIGGTIALGATYMLSGALKKLWKFITPVRWVTSKILTGGSMLVYKGKKKEKMVQRHADGTPVVFEETPYFSTGSIEEFDRTCDYYRKGNNVESLTTEAIVLLENLIDHFNLYSYNDCGKFAVKKYRFISDERCKRERQQELDSLNKEYYPEVETQPFDDSYQLKEPSVHYDGCTFYADGPIATTIPQTTHPDEPNYYRYHNTATTISNNAETTDPMPTKASKYMSGDLVMRAGFGGYTFQVTERSFIDPGDSAGWWFYTLKEVGARLNGNPGPEYTRVLESELAAAVQHTEEVCSAPVRETRWGK